MPDVNEPKLLEQTLEEEKETDAKLTSLSKKVNPTAAGGEDQGKRVEGSTKKTASHHAA
ncbi:hypothetical protein [Paracidobacterium acidisoli]|uniref:hypothetical protein n=1 Tax=Paracidobacterium acidisoli TaxID=2303751 RepID=UPI001314082A|nr:hypothetical protein [Paracidobacterium acidisoli]MBT9330861.1 hypothetical protein [Paracidobacterium acidisoli]